MGISALHAGFAIIERGSVSSGRASRFSEKSSHLAAQRHEVFANSNLRLSRRCLCSAFALLAASTFDAHAACIPSAVSDGQTVTCSGVDEQGVGTGGETGVSVTILEGATVDDNVDFRASVDLGTGATVVNQGTILGDRGIAADASSKITNLGAIDIQEGSSPYGIDVGKGSTVINEGTIIVEGSGSDPFGVGMMEGSTLINNGRIEVSGRLVPRGVQSWSAGGTVIENYGEIVSIGTAGAYKVIGVGVNSYDTLLNEGLIRAENMQSGATVTAVAGGANRTITNNDRIEAVADGPAYGFEGNSDDKVVNNGKIEVSSVSSFAVGILEAYGIDLMNTGDIVVTGATDAVGVHVGGGSHLINKGNITADGKQTSYGFYLWGDGALSFSGSVELDNAGTIKADVAIVTVANTDSMVEPAAIIVNSGKIEGDIVLGDPADTLTNKAGGVILGHIDLGLGKNLLVNEAEALISAQATAVDAGKDSGNVIRNAGRIVSSDGVAVIVADGNGVLNEGTIETNGTKGIGIVAGNSNTMFLGTDGWSGITNVGEIDAGFTGIAVGNDNTVRNYGTISSKGVGIAAGELNFVLNQGTIEILDGGLAAISAGAGNAIRNEGTIKSAGDGIVTGSGASNTGSITAAGDAIRVDGSAGGYVTNAGYITAPTAYRGSGGDDRFGNTWSLQGDIILLEGNDTLDLGDRSVTKGDIDGGTGNDIITTNGDVVLSGLVQDIEGMGVTGGTARLDLKAGSTIDRTVINAGAGILLNGELSGTVEIDEFGELSGSATVTGSVTNAGIVSPGNSIGTLAIDGTYTQGSTGELFVELDGTAADKLAVTGEATLDGALTTGLVARDLSTLEGKSYTVLTAGSIAGALDTAGIVQQGFWTLDVQQTGTAVTVTVVDVDVTIGASVPFTTSLSNAVAGAAASQTQGGGIVFEGGGNNPLPIGDQQSTSLDYDSMGDWESTAAAYMGGFDGIGARTPTAAMPKTGSAEFEGTTKGELTGTGSPEAFVVEGNVMLTADFARGLVNADFTGMEKIDRDGVASAWVDFRARMSIADGTSEFAGTAGTDDGVWNGEARGGFFGDDDGMPGHAAGLWSISSPLGRALGGFTARRQ